MDVPPLYGLRAYPRDKEPGKAPKLLANRDGVERQASSVIGLGETGAYRVVDRTEATLR